ncbi:MAG: phage portal protein, partial [Staphylococcus lugdunensis]|nr:phage portal protein [Staphylococcus lugdunensis]
MFTIIRFPWDKTYGEEIVEQLKPKEETQEEMIVRLILNHQSNIERISTGERYYNKQNDIYNQYPKLDLDGKLDVDKPDWRITTNYHQNLVDQKVAYLATKPVTYSCDDNKALEAIHSVLDNKWDNKLIDVLTAASNKGVDWIQPYIDENGDFKLFRVPAEQAIPIWTDKERDTLQAFIRVFEFNNETKVEYWTADDVTYYVYDNDMLINDYYY